MKSIAVIILSFFIISSAQSQCDCSNQGDLNASGTIDISDLIFFVDYSFNSGSEPFSDITCSLPNRGDLNCDNLVDISDIIYMVQYYFQNGFAPCDYCIIENFPQPGNVDSLTYQQVWDLYFTIFDNDSSVYNYINFPGVITDTASFYNGLYTSYFTQQKQFSKVSQIRLPLNVLNSIKQLPKSSFVIDSTQKALPSISFIPSFIDSNDIEYSPTTFTINDNFIQYDSMSESFHGGTGLIPSLAENFIEIMSSPPQDPTPQQITDFCGQDSLFINASLFAVRHNKNYTLFTFGNTYLNSYSNNFYIMNIKEYDCLTDTTKQYYLIFYHYYFTLHENSTLMTENKNNMIFYNEY